MSNHVSTIKRLAEEVGWSRFDLLVWIRASEMRYWQDSLDDTLADIDKQGRAERLLTDLIGVVPFRIELDNLDDEEGFVMVYCNSQVLAKHDQTISGSRWECPSDMTVGYACIADHPGLLKELEADGYTVNADNYCPPDEVNHGEQETEVP